jgi:hypothetical protein
MLYLINYLTHLMKRTKTLLILGLSVALSIGLTSFDIMNPSGAPAGTTGSPADVNTCASCASCHNGPANVVSGWITTNIPAEGYTPGTTYQITCTNNLTNSGRYGFECSPQDASGNLVGTIAAVSGNKIISSKYITHSTSNSTTKTWTFNWTAPAATISSATFYASFAKGYGGAVAKTSLTVTKATGAGIASINPKAQLAITPNPSQGRFNVINLPEQVDGIQIFDLTGNKVYQTGRTETNSGRLDIDLGNQSAGVYLLNLTTNGNTVSKKVVIK